MTRRSQSRVRYINRAQKKQVRCAPEVLGHRMNQPSLRKSAITVESVWEERDERDASPLTSQQRLKMQIVVNCCACSGAATEQGREKAGKTEDWREDWQSAEGWWQGAQRGKPSNHDDSGERLAGSDSEKETIEDKMPVSAGTRRVFLNRLSLTRRGRRAECCCHQVGSSLYTDSLIQLRGTRWWSYHWRQRSVSTERDSDCFPFLSLFLCLSLCKHYFNIPADFPSLCLHPWIVGSLHCATPDSGDSGRTNGGTCNTIFYLIRKQEYVGYLH